MKFKDRLKQARKEAHLSQTKLAEATNLTQAMIQSLESGRVKSTTHLLKLADALNTDPKWLETGERVAAESNNQLKITTKYRTYPLLYPSEVLTWLSENKMPTGRTVEMMPSLTEASTRAFNIDITNDAAANVFMPKSLFFKRLTALIDPETKPQLNSIVWVRVGNNDFKLRQYIKDGNDIYLQAFDSQYPSIKLEKDMEIIGTMLGLQQDLASH